jgi:Ca2+-binding RTX toxin-like protein
MGDLGDDYLYGDDGNDTLDGEGGDDFLQGGLGDDAMNGSNGNDTILGEDGEDFIAGNNDDDSIVGGADNDHIDGDAGDDTIYGDGGDDYIDPGAGTGNYIYGGSGFNLLGVDDMDAGGDGVQTSGFTPGSGTLTIEGNTVVYEDMHGLVGTEDADRFEDSGGNDNYFDGYDGDDILIGGSGDDSLIGNDGNDSLVGAGGTDTLFGDLGVDTLNGGAGIDYLHGGTGADVFKFDQDGVLNVDSVTDFDAAEDKIYLDGSVFTGLATIAGHLDTAYYHANISPLIGAQSSANVLYDTNEGFLYYTSSGGAGFTNAVIIATLSDGIGGTPDLQADDIIIY